MNSFALFLIKVRQLVFSSHTWILKDFLYSQPVCTHFPHCSEYWKICFERYDFLPALKYTMERIANCKPSEKIKYDPPFYKVVFFSSAPIGIPFLDKLLEDKRFEVVWVVSGPDKPAWRGQKLQENKVIEFLKKKLNHSVEDIDKELQVLHTDWKKIKVFKPEKIKQNQKFIQELKDLEADFFVVISYGKILPKEVLDIPKFWPINIHWSILPKRRWASPIQSVFLNKEKETGITLMYMNEKMDEWDIIKILKFPLTKNDNAKTVIDKFSKYWPDFLVDTLWDFAKWKIKPIKQDDSKATYCWKFTKEDGLVSFKKEKAEDIYAKFQAFYLWPGIYTFWDWKILKFKDIDYDDENLEPAKVYWKDNKLKIWTPKWSIIVKKLQIEWKKVMDAKEFVNWYKDFVWTVLD